MKKQIDAVFPIGIFENYKVNQSDQARPNVMVPQ